MNSYVHYESDNLHLWIAPLKLGELIFVALTYSNESIVFIVQIPLSETTLISRKSIYVKVH